MYEKKLKFVKQPIGPSPDPETADPKTIDKYYESTIVELHAMLKLHEKSIPKKAGTHVVDCLYKVGKDPKGKKNLIRGKRIPQAPDRYGFYVDVEEYELRDLNDVTTVA
ncbi:hypothetical protein Tco_0802136 [Tanacetum coccineum]|uniref:Uncharacterized protein n=1 Tax=Tanacetum coccineum TaxID=301880 RepID=A0ABQ5A291_9ASTR